MLGWGCEAERGCSTDIAQQPHLLVKFHFKFIKGMLKILRKIKI